MSTIFSHSQPLSCTLPYLEAGKGSAEKRRFFC